MPIITLGTTEPEAIIVETGTLPEDFYSTLQTSDVEMQEPMDFNTKASLIANDMNETEYDEEQPTDNAKKSNTNNTRKKDESKKNGHSTDESSTETLKVRSDLLEFSARSDGSVNCKICGKIFASRQHWYRHKYRAHVAHPPVDPVPLNKCEKCLIFFKSRKGYLGHMSSKHSETLLDATPVLINEQATTFAKWQNTRVVKPVITVHSKPELSDPETDIPKTIMQNPTGPTATSEPGPSRNTSRTRSVSDKKKLTQSTAKAPEEIDPIEYQERRVKDESFVMGIIEKVRRQCATEPEVASRRGYSRKPYSART